MFVHASVHVWDIHAKMARLISMRFAMHIAGFNAQAYFYPEFCSGLNSEIVSNVSVDSKIVFAIFH